MKPFFINYKFDLKQIQKEDTYKALIVLKYIYPKASENIQIWKKDINIVPGVLYYVKLNNIIVQIFFELDESYLNDSRVLRILKKRDVLPYLDFIMINKNKRWRIGWKL